ncbi:collagen binding domain-containing protein [Streptomyces sp. NPDC059874]|uniref:MSCRAMM family protein n=1 Tax=Streptomyces sp. NPDC059874 TaxID=3346983 RepID=UPI003647FF9F
MISVGLVPALASAQAPAPSLLGSNFEIDTDANLRVDRPDLAGELDWANVTQVRRADTPSGQTDNAFGGGSKEDDVNTTVGFGGVPDKSDLKNFGVFQEGGANGGFLHMYWTRGQDNDTGTTNYDFEFNKSQTPSNNGVTPLRSAGDLLISYDLSKGGTHPVLRLRRWVGNSTSGQWGTSVDLTSAGLATGSINTSAIPASESDGLGALNPRTFGEASVDLRAIFGSNGCTSLGSAFVKSRASDSFTSTMKDFIAPANISISNCGSVEIIKTNDADRPLADATFTLYTDGTPVGGTRGPASEDPITTFTCTTAADGKCTITAVPKGFYWVVETGVPAGHTAAPETAIEVVASEKVQVPLINPRQTGAILVTKNKLRHPSMGEKKISEPHVGVEFTVNGVTKVTDSHGQACFDGLLFGDYTVTETTPANYTSVSDRADNKLTVDNAASCPAPNGPINGFEGETIDFINTPLSRITVDFDSQVTNPNQTPQDATASKISCTGQTADTPDTTPTAFDDDSETFSDLLPGTYTCTVIIDP